MSQLFSNDILFKSYLKNNHHFADMINAGIFHGKPVIDPEKLVELDPHLAIKLDSGAENVITLERIRDLVKAIDMGDYILVLGIENQKRPHYQMASRILLYDAALIDVLPRDKPRIYQSLVVYLGERRWRVKTHLLDELKIPEEHRREMNDWQMHFLDLNRTDPKIFKTKDNQDLTKLIQMIYIWNGDVSVFKLLNMSREVIVTAASATSSRKILKELESLEETQLRGGRYMCRAVNRALKNAEKQAVEEARRGILEEGKLEGLLEGRQEGKN